MTIVFLLQYRLHQLRPCVAKEKLSFILLSDFSGISRLEYFLNSVSLTLVLEGRRIAFGASRKRKVRTPKGAMPRNPSPFDWDTRGREAERLFDGQCHRKSDRRSPFDAARVKRWCKRPPREAQ